MKTGCIISLSAANPNVSTNQFSSSDENRVKCVLVSSSSSRDFSDTRVPSCNLSVEPSI
jgi:hypothetical protein